MCSDIATRHSRGARPEAGELLNFTLALMSPTFFRCLVLCSVLLLFASAIVDWLFPYLVSQAITTAIENEPMPSFLENHPFLALTLLLPWLIVVLASTIGLLFFKRWARVLALYSTLFSFGFYPLLGLSVSSALATAFSDASLMLWGAVLALAYYAPVSERFVTKERIRER